MDEDHEEGAVFDHQVKYAGEMISPAPPLKFRWGVGRIILPTCLATCLIRTAPFVR
jgi:hypothetical protein